MIKNWPFCALLQDATFKKYASTAARLLVYVIREHLENDDPALALPPLVHAAVEALIPCIVEQQAPPGDLIHAVLWQLFTHQWDRTGGYQKPPDPTIRFLAAFMMRDAEGRTSPPALVTPVISHIEYLIRIVLLHEMHQAHHGEDQMVAFEQVRMFLIEDAPTTFAAIRSLKHQATSSALRTPRPTMTYFPHHTSREELILRGHLLSFGKLKDLVVDLQKEIIQVAEQLSFGHDLEAEHGELHDDLRCTNTNYSVFTDPRNETFKPEFALRKFLNLPGVFSHFFLQLPSGQVIWRHPRARSWLQLKGRLDLLIMVAAHITGGGLARGTEITAMRVRSAVHSPEILDSRPLQSRNAPNTDRNVFAFGPVLAVVGIVNKTSGLTHKDHFIPRPLDALLTAVVKLVHVIFRPFACMVADACFEGDQRLTAIDGYTNLMFCGFGGEQFTTDHLSKELCTRTAKHLGAPLGVADMRHVLTAWHRHIGELHDPDVQAAADNEEAAALQNGHSLFTDIHHYAPSNVSLPDVDNASILRAIASSRRFQIALGDMPSGVSKVPLTIKEAHPDNWDYNRRTYDLEDIEPTTAQARHEKSLVKAVTSQMETVINNQLKAVLNPFKLDLEKIVKDQVSKVLSDSMAGLLVSIQEMIVDENSRIIRRLPEVSRVVPTTCARSPWYTGSRRQKVPQAGRHAVAACYTGA